MRWRRISFSSSSPIATNQTNTRALSPLKQTHAQTAGMDGWMELALVLGRCRCVGSWGGGVCRHAVILVHVLGQLCIEVLHVARLVALELLVKILARGGCRCATTTTASSSATCAAASSRHCSRRPTTAATESTTTASWRENRQVIENKYDERMKASGCKDKPRPRVGASVVSIASPPKRRVLLRVWRAAVAAALWFVRRTCWRSVNEVPARAVCFSFEKLRGNELNQFNSIDSRNTKERGSK